MRKTAAVLGAVLGMIFGAGGSQAGSDATGLWRLADGKVTVRVANCGSAMCGTVVGLKKPRDDKGRPRLDKENPDPALRARPVIGLTILRNMNAAGDGYWTGTIYNPDDGRTYRSRMKLQGADTMTVNGCVAAVFCRSMTFVRVD